MGNDQRSESAVVSKAVQKNLNQEATMIQGFFLRRFLEGRDLSQPTTSNKLSFFGQVSTEGRSRLAS